MSIAPVIEDAWNEVREASIIGAGRLTKAPDLESSLGIPLDPPDIALDAALLQQLSMLAVMMRSGRAASDTGLSGLDANPAPEDTRPTVSTKSVFHLSTILSSGGHSEMLPEWLGMCVSAGKRVPHALLPELMNSCKGNPTNVTLACSVIGARGFWLAARNPSWVNFFTSAWSTQFPDSPQSIHISSWSDNDIETIWHTGSREERLNLLLALRRNNPPKAFELAGQTWKKDGVVQRSQIVRLLSKDAKPDDEAFFESVLDDRSQEVKWIAAQTLLKMPQAAIHGRFKSRAVSLIRPVKQLLIGIKLDINEPDAPKPEDTRDGLHEVGNLPANAGPTATYIQFVVSGIAPKFWLSELSIPMTPPQFIGAVKATKWKDAILAGLQSSSIFFNDSTFAEVLIDELIKAKPEKASALGLDQVRELVSVMPPPQRDKILIDLIRQSQDWYVIPRIAHELKNLSTPCSTNVWRAILNRIIEIANHANNTEATYLLYSKGTLTTVAERLPVELIDEVRTGWPTNPPHGEKWQEVVDSMIDTLNFRIEMAKEILAK